MILVRISWRKLIGFNNEESPAHYAKTDLNKKSGAMHQTLIFFNIDAKGLRKAKNENPLTWEIEVTT